MYDELEFSVLEGKIIKSIKINDDKDEIIFTLNNDEKYKMFHGQDCCEVVKIEEIIGDLNDLIDTVIIKAEERSWGDKDIFYKEDYQPDSETWTFYELATEKGYVTIRWMGSSNGYYSESVDFIKI